MRSALAFALFAALVVLVACSDDDDTVTYLHEDYSSQRNCWITQFPPRKPNSLLFCSKFNDNSCCNPAQDDENLNMFQLLHDTGLSCRLRGDLRVDPMAVLYCLNCDPKQPQYVRNLPYYAMMTIGGYLNNYPLIGFPSSRNAPLPSSCFDVLTDGSFNENLTPLSQTAANFKDCFSTRNTQVLLCKDWMVNNFKIRPNIMSIFDKCMIQKNAPCLALDGAIIPNRDRYTCGNDLINPGRFYTVDSGFCALNNLDVDSDECRTLYMEKAINQDSLGTPQIDENFGWRLVDNVLCTDDQYDSWWEQFTEIQLNTTGNSTFNPHILNGPTCLLPKHLVIQMYNDLNNLFGSFNLYTSNNINNNLTEAWVSDEMCFNSATGMSALTVSSLALLVATLLVAWIL